jgi:hypothetical protein
MTESIRVEPASLAVWAEATRPELRRVEAAVDDHRRVRPFALYAPSLALGFDPGPDLGGALLDLAADHDQLVGEVERFLEAVARLDHGDPRRCVVLPEFGPQPIAPLPLGELADLVREVSANSWFAVPWAVVNLEGVADLAWTGVARGDDVRRGVGAGGAAADLLGPGRLATTLAGDLLLPFGVMVDGITLVHPDSPLDDRLVAAGSGLAGITTIAVAAGAPVPPVAVTIAGVAGLAALGWTLWEARDDLAAAGGWVWDHTAVPVGRGLAAAFDGFVTGIRSAPVVVGGGPRWVAP